MRERGFLERILARKREEVARLQEAMASVPDLRRKAVSHQIDQMNQTDQKDQTSFLLALTTGPVPRIIAEVKRASPSKGALSPDLDPARQARLYQEGGARAVSVLTDEDFRGSLEDLREVVSSVDLPVLRKDFIIHPLQLEETRRAGASAVLLIAAVFSPGELEAMVEESLGMGLEPLVEVHTREELEVALETPARVIGINSRNLRTFHVDLAVVEKLAPLVPPDRVVVAESGISSAEDVKRLIAAGVEAFLVGEALVRAEDPGAKLRELMGHG